MYLSFFHLKHKPFQISTDPKFLWLGEKHEEALATLRYGVLDNKGFLLLTGDVGTGKTTLINTLQGTLGDNTLVATIRDPALEPEDFFNYIAHSFGMGRKFTSKGSFLIRFEQFLHEAHSANKKVLLVIDEAQRISQELLEEVRLLSNIEKEDSKLLNIFFVGQIEFNEILLRHENRAIRQRITINYNIDPLTESETEQYILHRLKVAGTGEEPPAFVTFHKNPKAIAVPPGREVSENQQQIFLDEAIQEIHSYSGGYPRLINIICDRSLLTGFVEESKVITQKHVQECVKELSIPQLTRIKNIVEEISGEPEKETTYLTAEIPEKQVAQQNMEPKSGGTFRRVIFACCALLLVVFSYFLFSPNGVQHLQNFSLSNALETFQQKGSPTVDEIIDRQPVTTQKPQLSEDKQPADTGIKNIAQPAEISDPITTSVSLQSQSEPVKKKELTILREKTKSKKLPGKEIPQEENDKKAVNAVTVDKTETSEQKQLTQTNKKTVKKKQDNSVNQQETISKKKTTSTGKKEPSSTTSSADQITIQQMQIKTLSSPEKIIIPFPSNTNLPPVSELDNLNMLVENLLKRSSYKVIVTGFTDSQGDEALNQQLSVFRANVIKSYLVGKGVDPSRVIIQGLGSQYPIVSNETFLGRMANRRVEIEVDR